MRIDRGQRAEWPPVVFISALTHSGSTLLDLILGSQKGYIGLGEVVPLLRPGAPELHQSGRTCSCSKTLTECPFWSRVATALKGTPATSVPERYCLLLEIFSQVFGQGVVLVDSSKSTSSLRAVSQVPGIDLRVIHLIRDVRGWFVSQRSADRRKRRRQRAKPRRNQSRALRLAKRTSIGSFLIWYHGNQRIRQLIRERGLEYHEVSYEKLALKTESTVTTLGKFLGLSSPDIGNDLTDSSSHVLLGNRMRLDEKRRSKIRYDNAWKSERGWRVPAALLPHVMRSNQVWVYEC